MERAQQRMMAAVPEAIHGDPRVYNTSVMISPEGLDQERMNLLSGDDQSVFFFDNVRVPGD
ncbi:MAG TPA: hypothetical protein EYO85_10055, partial [Rhodospirillales bacterium]|nr:hypothetical protein [Rhodospirillales bacterium]